MDKKLEQQVLVLKYLFEEDYNPKYVNGGYGGINPKGEIVLNFYLERSALPTSQTFKINDGKLESEITEERKPSDHKNSFVRYIQNGIVLNLQSAKEIKSWLEDKINLLEKQSINDK
jgi:hypothetical protein